MGFKLKTNNRKVESGTIITAKIVSPDKSAYDYQDFSIVVQPQSLSDKEKVIRDAQTIASILDSNNPDWTHITDKIRGVVEASKAATYCDVFYGDITSPSGNSSLIDSGEDINHNRIVNVNNGEVIKRPPYNASSTSPGFTATLQMSVKSGDEVEIIRRPFTVPMYTKAEVLGTISDYWTETKIWDLIKNSNTNKNAIHSNLTVPSALSALTALGIDSIVDSTNDANVPALEFTFPSYYTPDDSSSLVSATGEVAAIPATEAWQMDRDLYTVTGLASRDLSQEDCGSYGIQNSKSKGEVVLYRFASKNTDQNKITTKWSYDNGATNITKDISGINFLSQLVRLEDIRANIAQSFSLGWFIPPTALASYVVDDTTIGTNNSQNNRKIVTVPAGKHVVLQLPSKFSTMITTDTNPVVDKTKIGYSYSPAEGLPVGFTDNMFSAMQINFTQPLHSTYSTIEVDNASDADPTNTIGDNTEFTAEPNNTKYLYLNTSEAVPFNGSLTLTLNENALGAGANVTVYFSIQIGS